MSALVRVTVRSAVLTSLLAAVYAAGALGVQVPDSVPVDPYRCLLWVTPPGGDHPRTWGQVPCTEGSRPVFLPGNDMPPTPEITTYVSASFKLQIDSLGRVERFASRGQGAYVWGLDHRFYDELEALAMTWRFQPGRYKGRPVRSDLLIDVQTPPFRDGGSDTIPQRVIWAHESTEAFDSIRGVWRDMPAPPEMPVAEQLKVLNAAFDELVSLELLYGDNAYCPIMAPDVPESFRHIRLTANATSEPTCALRPGSLRLYVSRVYPQFPGKAVVMFSGDVPPEAQFPQDDGQLRHLWRSWSARCVLFRQDDGSWEATCPTRNTWGGVRARRGIY